ncbi:MAG: hypothetical protein HY720_07390 [Planctomycetes bacterium]|nr:hypothetical protein [Planctomycetota bacterium]
MKKSPLDCLREAFIADGYKYIMMNGKPVSEETRPRRRKAKKRAKKARSSSARSKKGAR